MPATHHAVVVLYDPETGDIVHGHYCEADSNDELPDKSELETAAREYARRHARRGVDSAKAQALHVEPASFRMNQKYRVDPQLRKLVEL